MRPLLWPFVSVGRFVSSFHPRALPPMLRHSYSRELLAWWLLPMMLAAVEGGVVGVLVKNAFEGVPGLSQTELNYIVAALHSAPAIANMSSFMWAAVSLGKRKVPMIITLQSAAVVAVALVALAPHTSTGAYMLTACVIVARLCWSGVLTIRTGVWRANYPRADRARIAGRLSSVGGFVITVTGAIIGLAMDFDPEAYRVLFPLVAVGGAMGTWVYSRVRLRGERRLMRAEQAGRTEALTFNPVSIARLLLRDSTYALYMACMFVFGMGNLMTVAMLPIVLRDVFRYENFTGILITTALPRSVQLLAIPMWAMLLDRWHVIRFRVTHSWLFATSSLLAMLAVGTGSGWLMVIMSIVLGIGFGGGVLAWNLGHHDFAGEHNASQYMGVHVTLTGVRGVIAPFVGVTIYEALGVSQGAGQWVFAVALALNLLGAIGFAMLWRAHRRHA